MGVEPLDLLLLCRLSYEVGQRKSGTIKVVNRGEEKVRVHMNVVPRSTMNTNGGTDNYYSWLFIGLISTLIYDSELVLCSTICVHSATRHNIFA